MTDLKNKWKWWEILLWAYSTLYVLILTVIFIIAGQDTSTYTPTTTPAEDAMAATIMGFLFVPVLFHLIKEGKRKLS